MKEKESDIQKCILDWLSFNRYWYRRMPLGGVLQSRGGKQYYKKNPLVGFPDIMGLLKTKPGHMFVIEVKTPKGRLSADQRTVKEQLENAGVIYILATNLVTVVEALHVYDRPHYH